MLRTFVTNEALGATSCDGVPGIDDVALEAADAGAWVEFRGLVRRSSNGRAVAAMTYDGHPGLIVRAMDKVGKDVARSISAPWRARVDLRLGYLTIGEASVQIVTVSAHRAAAYDASRAILEGLKRWAPIWKCEHLEDGSSVWLDGRSLRAGND